MHGEEGKEVIYLITQQIIHLADYPKDSGGNKGGDTMKGSDTIKKVPKNVWIVLIALGVGYMLYRNIHRN